jgi:hypothetical protein
MTHYFRFGFSWRGSRGDARPVLRCILAKRKIAAPSVNMREAQSLAWFIKPNAARKPRIIEC